MSSDEEGRRKALQPASKRQRRGAACDMCRKRKLKCDGKRPGSEKCTNCTDHKRDCTFFNAPGKKVAPGYIEALETKVRKLQSLIKRMLPGQDFTHEIGYELTRDNWMLPGVCGAPEPEHPSAFVTAAASTPDTVASSALSVMASDHPTMPTPVADDGNSSDEDRRDPAIPLRNLRAASRWSSWSHHMSGHLGKSLGTTLVRTAFEMCKELVPNFIAANALHLRNQLWERPAWLDGFGDDNSQKPFTFPSHDLMSGLIECYFASCNLLLPVLHRPTFEEDLRSDLHLRDRTFGNVVLLVCAIGSRYSHDPRVLENGDRTWLSAGWGWYTQTRILDDVTLVSPASHLFVLQAMCLGTMYMASISLTHAWMYTGSGIRLAVDIGAHKRHAYGLTLTLEDELYKRAFWILLYLDRTLSTIMGRPSCIQEEDFDLEMPHCCDDEYLTHENSEQVGQQPSYKPSLLSYFVWMLKLTQIQGLALRTVYASTKAKAHFHFQGEEWLERTVAHFDSLLNSWVDSIPEHLRWDPTHTNDAFFVQSAYLYSQYHTTQMIVHRPYLSTPHRTPVPFPSLVICTNAARSLTRIANVTHQRKKDLIGGLTWMIQYAGLVTLVALGHARAGKLRLDHKQALEDVDSLIYILREGAVRWRWSGRQADVVESLRVLGETPLDELQDSEAPRKRPREANFPGDPIITENMHTAAPALSLTQHSTSAHESASATEWNTSMMFGDAADAELSAYATDHLHTNSLSQSTGAVFGNIDFAALFGFGDPSSEGLRPWSPSPFDGASSSGMPSLASGEQSLGITTLGYGVEDWQWMAPPELSLPDQELTNDARRPR